MFSDQQTQFNWDQNRKEVEQAYQNLSQVKKDMIKLQVSSMQKWHNIDNLKAKLILLIQKLQIELKTFGRYIDFKANSFKNKLQKNLISKFTMNMNKTVKNLLGASALIMLVAGGILGLEYAAVIGALTVGARTGLKHALGIGFGVGVVLIAGDLTYSYYQASKNKEKFKEVIQETQKALKEVEKRKKDLN